MLGNVKRSVFIFSVFLLAALFAAAGTAMAAVYADDVIVRPGDPTIPVAAGDSDIMEKDLIVSNDGGPTLQSAVNVQDNASLEVQGKMSVASTSEQLTEGIRMQEGSSVSLQSLDVIANNKGNTTGVNMSGAGTTLTVNGLLTVDGNIIEHVGVDLNAQPTGVMKPKAYLSDMVVKGGLGVHARDGTVVFSGDVTVSGGTGVRSLSNGIVTLLGDLNVTGGIGLEAAASNTVHGATTVSGDGVGVYTTSGNSSVVTLHGSFDVIGASAVGVSADGGTTNLSTMTVDGGTGISMKGNGRVTISDDLTVTNSGTGAGITGGTLTVNGLLTVDGATGVVAAGGNTFLSGADISSGGSGVKASGTANVIISEDWNVVDGTAVSVSGNAKVRMLQDLNASIISFGTTAPGASVESGDFTVLGATTASGEKTTGVSQSGGAVTLNTLSADNGATGARVSGGAMTTGAVTADNGATGANVSGGATLTVTDLLTVLNKSTGVVAQNGDAFLSGADISSGVGVNAYSSATNVTISEDWTVSGGWGAQVREGANVRMQQDLNVSGTGSGAHVVSGDFTVQGATTVDGAGALGVFQQGGVATLNTLSADNGATGARVFGGTLTAGTVTVGANAYGVFAAGGNSWLNNVDVTGANAYGAYASNDGKIYVSNDIRLGDLAAGSYGAVADSGGTVNVAGGILSFGSDSAAAFAYGQSVSGDRSTINIVDLINGGDVIVLTTGTNSHALHAIVSGEINMTQGEIKAIDATSWHMYTDFDGRINLFDVSADASTTLNLLRTDSSGNVHATSSYLVGDITHTGEISGGDLDVLMDGGTRFYGAANASTGVPGARINITLDAISTDADATDYWYVTKDSNTQGNLTNRGLVDFAHATSADILHDRYVVDDSAYKKITVDSFAGSDPAGVDMLGRLRMKVDIHANKGDLIHSLGTATGSNEIDLQVMGYAGGVERMPLALVRVEDGANSDAKFTLMDNEVTAGGVADAGAWNYVLEEGMDGLAQEWHLKRNGLTSLGYGLVQGAVTPEMWYTEVATLYDRMANYKDPSYKGGIWASASYRKVEFDGDGNTYGMLPFDVEMKTLTIGYDQKNSHSNGTWYHGIMMGYGREERDSWVGDADTDSFHATIYTVYKQDRGFYLSALAKFNHYDTDLTVNAVDKLTKQFGYDQVVGGMNQRGLGMSLMAGQRFNMGNDGWYFEPQAQLSYMRIFGDKYVTNSGLDVDVEATTSLRARAGFLFGKAMLLNNGAQLDLFADLSINKEFDGETDIWLSGGKFTRDLGDTWGSYGLGFSWRMNDRSYLGGRIAYGSGSDREEPISATLGILFETN